MSEPETAVPPSEIRDRRDRILKNLNLSGRGLEIGPGYDPIVAGVSGFNVAALDHLDQKGLQEKYSTENVDIGRIPHIDYVWNGERYSDLMPGERFDWIIASHVIEHVPDFVGFINQCAEIMTPGGILSLVIPDKRYTFDCFRPVSGLAEYIDAHLTGRTKTTPGEVVEHIISSAELGGSIVWCAGAKGKPKLRYTIENAKGALAQVLDGQYLDVHQWIFTPSSLRLNLSYLDQLGFTELGEISFHESVGCEFFLQLGRQRSGQDVNLVDLAVKAQAEEATAEVSYEV